MACTTVTARFPAPLAQNANSYHSQCIAMNMEPSAADRRDLLANELLQISAEFAGGEH